LTHGQWAAPSPSSSFLLFFFFFPPPQYQYYKSHMRLLHRLKGAGIFFIYFLFLGTFPAGNYFDTCMRVCVRVMFRARQGKKRRVGAAHSSSGLQGGDYQNPFVISFPRLLLMRDAMRWVEGEATRCVT